MKSATVAIVFLITLSFNAFAEHGECTHSRSLPALDKVIIEDNFVLGRTVLDLPSETSISEVEVLVSLTHLQPACSGQLDKPIRFSPPVSLDEARELTATRGYLNECRHVQGLFSGPPYGGLGLRVDFPQLGLGGEVDLVDLSRVEAGKKDYDAFLTGKKVEVLFANKQHVKLTAKKSELRIGEKRAKARVHLFREAGCNKETHTTLLEVLSTPTLSCRAVRTIDFDFERKGPQHLEYYLRLNKHKMNLGNRSEHLQLPISECQ